MTLRQLNSTPIHSALQTQNPGRGRWCERGRPGEPRREEHKSGASTRAILPVRAPLRY